MRCCVELRRAAHVALTVVLRRSKQRRTRFLRAASSAGSRERMALGASDLPTTLLCMMRPARVPTRFAVPCCPRARSPLLRRCLQTSRAGPSARTNGGWNDVGCEPHIRVSRPSRVGHLEPMFGGPGHPQAVPARASPTCAVLLGLTASLASPSPRQDTPLIADGVGRSPLREASQATARSRLSRVLLPSFCCCEAVPAGTCLVHSAAHGLRAWHDTHALQLPARCCRRARRWVGSGPLRVSFFRSALCADRIVAADHANHPARLRSTRTSARAARLPLHAAAGDLISSGVAPARSIHGYTDGRARASE